LILTACAAGDDDDDNDDQSPPPDDDDDNDTAGADLLDTARALADTWLASYPPATMGWSWDSGVLMLGLWELFRATGEATYHNYVREWLDYHISQGYTIAYNDHVPPARLALRLWQETGDAPYRQAVDAAKTYIFEKADRLADGAMVHMGWQTPTAIWIDTLFMVTPFLGEVGSVDGEARCYADAVKQFATFAAHLRDADTGLYRHRYDDADGSVTPAEPDYWARGNAWVVAASGTAFVEMPAAQTGLADIATRFDAQVESLGAWLQTANRWPTIVNRPATYLETSAGALIAYGIYQAAAADRATDGQLALADRALRGALDQAVADGTGDTLLLGTSYGTGPSTWEMYDYVLKGEQVTYGVGAAILAITARAALGREDELPPAQQTTETFIPKPASANATEWGYFYLARGDFYSASDSFAATPNEPAAELGLGLIEAVRFAMEVLDLVDRYALDEISLWRLAQDFIGQGRSFGEGLLPRTDAMVADESFAQTVERLVLTEQGGSTAVGRVEIDRGEAFILQGLSNVLIGLGQVTDALGLDWLNRLRQAAQPWRVVWRLARTAPKLDWALLDAGLVSGIDACDSLIAAIDTIEAETDDQSDDLIPRNLLHLEGEYHIPGILFPTPVSELLADLGLDEFFAGKPMPDTLLDWLRQIKAALALLRAVLPNGAASA
jgi:unsaturated rhamnogalacturonyl hydrolase